MRVDFLIVGAQKCGTTALQHFLAGHPQLAWGRRERGNRKELHFFDDDRYFRGRNVDYDRYHAHFPRLDPQRPLRFGEATPAYVYWPGVPARIRTYNPDMKLILLLRDPAERAFSHYRMLALRGKEERSFSRAIREEQSLRESGRYVPHRLFSYVDRGFYHGQIERLLRHFPREQILFLRSDALKRRHMETVDRVCRFLSVREIHHDDPQTVFATPPAQLRQEDRRFLVDLYREDVLRLESLLGWDLSGWRTPVPRALGAQRPAPNP